MMNKASCLTLSVFILFTINSCKKADNVTLQNDNSVHPCILLLKNEEQQIRNLIDSDETWKKMHFAILEESNKILGRSPLERVMIGRRLLSTSRELLRRVFFLSYSYRMTGDEKFLVKAEKELLAVAGFTDWNPSHFLDVAEMTMGVAIGYDWLYSGLSEESKKTIRNAIIDKGLKLSNESAYNSWLKGNTNWNQVCNAGMAFGALAVQENEPVLSKQIIDRAFETISLPMEAYQPDGAYQEGYGYWGYGTSFNIMFLSAMEKALKTDKGLVSTPGFLETADYLKHILTPAGKSFNYSDCGTGTSLNTTMFWFAERRKEPSVLWSEKKFLEIDDFSKFKGDRLLPAIMIWGKNIPLSNIDEPTEKVWIGQGANPVSMMRTSWTDPNALYVGFKAGSPSVNHGHMDTGSFIMEANGVQWASDLGMQNYESLESKGMSIFGKTQDAQRWTIFRMNTYSHNVLIVDDEQQRVNGYAKIDKFSKSDEFVFSVSDISAIYNGQLKNATRGIAIKDEKYVIIRDELETLNRITKIRWNMLTYAHVDLGGNDATLTLGGKRLFLKVQGPGNLSMKTWSTAPTNDYDAENPGTILLGFECQLPASAKETFEVLLIPEGSEVGAVFLNKKLEEWN